jgi:uncharacterized protein (DUF433 family)
MDLSERITVDPEICNGKPTIRGKRITVKTILEYIAAGETNANILKAYPTLVEEDIKAALDFAVHVMDNGVRTIKVK